VGKDIVLDIAVSWLQFFALWTCTQVSK